MIWQLFAALWAMPCHAAVVSYNLTISPGWKAPDGYWRSVYLVNGQQPGPLIEAEEGDSLQIFVTNNLPVATTIHWHGLLQHGTPAMDGVPGVSQFPIMPGQNHTYTFSTKGQYGYYWYHSHVRAYYDDAIRGPLLIHPAPGRSRPFASLARDSSSMAGLLEAERNATNVMLNDWTHSTSDELFSSYFTTGAYPFCVDSILINGKGRVGCMSPMDAPELSLGPSSMLNGERSNHLASSSPAFVSCVPSVRTTQSADSSHSSMLMKQSTSQAGMMQTMPLRANPTSTHSTMSGIAMHGQIPFADSASSTEIGSLSPRGCSAPMMFRDGYDETFLNPERCFETDHALTALTGTSGSWKALNLVNSGSVAMLAVSLDQHAMFVYAADGQYVAIQEVNVLTMGLGQRYSVLVKLSAVCGNYTFRANAVPTGDMQQIIEGRAMLVVTDGTTVQSPSAIRESASSSVGQSTVEHVSQSSSEKTNSHMMYSLLGETEEEAWVFPNGSAKSTAKVLNDSALYPYDNSARPPSSASMTKKFYVNQTAVTTWVLGDEPYEEAKVPVLLGNISEKYNSSTTYHIPANETVDIIMQIAEDSMDTMGHPMHLHGHKFWVLGFGTGQFVADNVTEALKDPAYNLNIENPAYRDTAHLPAQGWLVIRYVTDNPGVWILHCHIQWHLLSGMAVLLAEGDL